MKFKEYITETDDKFLDKEMKKFRTLCKPFLDMIKRKEIFDPLYRGTRQALSMFAVKTRRKHRKPKDTPEKIQKIADDIFYKEFKWKPRSEGVFATGSASLADNYGHLFWFFPIGSFHFVWSNRIEDFFLDNEWQDFYDKKWVENQGYKITYDPGHMSGIKNRMESIIHSFQDFDLQSAIEKGHEIMFDCDRYYMIDEKAFRNKLYSLGISKTENNHKIFDLNAYRYLIGD